MREKRISSWHNLPPFVVLCPNVKETGEIVLFSLMGPDKKKDGEKRVEIQGPTFSLNCQVADVASRGTHSENKEGKNNENSGLILARRWYKLEVEECGCLNVATVSLGFFPHPFFSCGNIAFSSLPSSIPLFQTALFCGKWRYVVLPHVSCVGGATVQNNH